MARLSDLENTLDDDAWKDSFDKLLDPRPVLRQLNILKRDVRASFNNNSSIENCSQDSSCLIVPTSDPTLVVPTCVEKRTGSISTPMAMRAAAAQPFKCSISPIGDWRLNFFNKAAAEVCQNEANAEKFIATPINSILIGDYEAEVEHVKSPLVINETDNELSLLPLIRRSSKVNANAKKPKRSKKHVCFESIVNNSLNKPTKATITTSKSLDGKQKSLTEAPNNKETQARPTSLTLQPGKWRKSLNVWRRTRQLAPENNKISNNAPCSTIAEDSVIFVAVHAVAGQRKSIYLKPEPLSDDNTEDNGNQWERQVLARCKQCAPLPFEQVYAAENTQNLRKIGEGAYGEVFMNCSKRRIQQANDTVLKIIPIEGEIEINGETQKSFEQILPEIIISMELSNLHNEANNAANITCGFVSVKRVTCINGQYPAHLIKLWEEYDRTKGSENDHPDLFPNTQLYIVLELSFSGKDMEAFIFSNAEQAYFALQQIVLTLAVGEAAFQFEHRDLHWGNVLILNTNEKQLVYKLHGKPLTVSTKGVKITIIDYTLSRMTFDDRCFYNDLSCDEELFTATGDYQFDIYRMMRDVLKNNWETYEPKTNVFWISYIITKMLDGVKYKNTRGKTHATFINKLSELREIVLNFTSATECAMHFQESI